MSEKQNTKLDETVSAEHRGKFMAFTEQNSQPVRHVKSLAESGVTHFHLLPIFDFASVNENKKQTINITDDFDALCCRYPEIKETDLACFCGKGKKIIDVFEELTKQDCIEYPIIQKLQGYISRSHSFNWGYDPFHYNAPEGSYATNANGLTRIRECREMILAIKQNIGMNVIMDVVYNHTFSSNPENKNTVLNKIVPWYYHRLNAFSGMVENSTCCDNTAPEHAMMARLIRDSLVMWTKEYKIDAFRFDLMGHHPLAQIQDSLSAVKAVNPDTYFYGEGWNFGEVAFDARFKQATQWHLAGTGIGSFSDRLRDAVRGGKPSDSNFEIRATQGFGNGAFVEPNECNAVSRETALHFTDIVRLGMAGNLRHFILQTHTGEYKRGDQIDYNGQPAGYAHEPTEIQNYVSKHDNQTLWDNNQYKIAHHVPLKQRVRMEAVSLATSMLGQGVPFTQQGVELLRSKSMQRDSYNVGDWYNRVDYSLQDNNWNKGLPCAEKDGNNFEAIQAVINGGKKNTQPSSSDIQDMLAYYKEFAELRKHYPLITLGKADEILNRVHFHNTGCKQIAGLIVMSIDNGKHSGVDIDPNVDALVIVINANSEQAVIDMKVEGLVLSVLHRSDLTESTKVEGTKLYVPAWTPAVFELKRSSQRGKGLPVIKP